jgi:hypothetical protein
MSGQEFADLVADIKAHGQREPIWRYHGKIIDGRHRYEACLEAGVKPVFREWDGKGDPLDLVLSLNFSRRHLNESQRAMLGARLVHWFRDQRSSPNLGLETGQRGKASVMAAGRVHVSKSSIELALQVIGLGEPELARAVDSGRLKVSLAAELSKLPRDPQVAICADDDPPKAARYALRELASKDQDELSEYLTNRPSVSTPAQQYFFKALSNMRRIGDEDATATLLERLTNEEHSGRGVADYRRRLAEAYRSAAARLREAADRIERGEMREKAQKHG